MFPNDPVNALIVDARNPIIDVPNRRSLEHDAHHVPNARLLSEHVAWQECFVPDGRVVVKGEVVRDTTALDAIRRVKKIEGVTDTIDQIPGERNANASRWHSKTLYSRGPRDLHGPTSFLHH